MKKQRMNRMARGLWKRAVIRRMLCVLLCLASAGLAPAAGAEAPGDGGIVERFVAECAAEQDSPWMRAILQAGAKNITWQGEKAEFALRGFNPELKSLGSYAEAADRQAWRDQITARLTAYDLRVSVTFAEDGSVSAREKKLFLKTVRAAAKKAKGAFEKKDLRRFLTDLLFRTPATGKKPKASELMAADEDFSAFIESKPACFPCESASEWAPLMYLQRNWTFSSAKGGPHEILMTWEGADPDILLKEAAAQADADLKQKTGTGGIRPEDLSYYWRTALAETAIRMKKGKLPKRQAVLDLDELLAGETPKSMLDYFAGYRPSEAFRALQETQGSSSAPEGTGR